MGNIYWQKQSIDVQYWRSESDGEISLKADFHSVQNVARSTFSERFLLNYKQSSGTNLISCG